MLRTLKSTTTLLIVTLFLLGNYAYSQWTPAPASPPTGNVPAPINVGSSAQTKTGDLTVDGVLDVDSQKITSGAPTILFDDTDNSNWYMHVNSNHLFFIQDFNSDGVWNYRTGGWPLEMARSVDGAGQDYNWARFADQVRAQSYCDQAGNNCIVPSGGGGKPTIAHWVLQATANGWHSPTNPGDNAVAQVPQSWYDVCFLTRAGGYANAGGGREVADVYCEVFPDGTNWTLRAVYPGAKRTDTYCAASCMKF